MKTNQHGSYYSFYKQQRLAFWNGGMVWEDLSPTLLFLMTTMLGRHFIIIGNCCNTQRIINFHNSLINRGSFRKYIIKMFKRRDRHKLHNRLWNILVCRKKPNWITLQLTSNCFSKNTLSMEEITATASTNCYTKFAMLVSPESQNMTIFSATENGTWLVTLNLTPYWALEPKPCKLLVFWILHFLATCVTTPHENKIVEVSHIKMESMLTSLVWSLSFHRIKVGQHLEESWPFCPIQCQKH